MQTPGTRPIARTTLVLLLAVFMATSLANAQMSQCQVELTLRKTESGLMYKLQRREMEPKKVRECLSDLGRLDAEQAVLLKVAASDSPQRNVTAKDLKETLDMIHRAGLYHVWLVVLSEAGIESQPEFSCVVSKTSVWQTGTRLDLLAFRVRLDDLSPKDLTRLRASVRRQVWKQAGLGAAGICFVIAGVGLVVCWRRRRSCRRRPSADS